MADPDFSPSEDSEEKPSEHEADDADDDSDDIPLADLVGKKPKKRAYIQLSHGGSAPREDQFPLPILPPGTKWEWKPTPGKRIVVMKDAVLAATNAVAKVWPDTEIVVGSCVVHASNRWLDSTGRCHLKSHKQNKEKMIEDFCVFRDTPTST